eukprot:gb/GEZN01010276.1/.p1 GENE.gb/GEZN01010276.1/~~gb/GEZN01010276.1/.p1  ORF type:complete len:193 (+),score=40.78 gb/GEZN01010276.1/:249-827(+)
MGGGGSKPEVKKAEGGRRGSNKLAPSKEELERLEQQKIQAYAGDGSKEQRRGSVIDELNMERTKSVNAFDLVVSEDEVKSMDGHFSLKLSKTQKEQLWEVYDQDKNGELNMEEMRRIMRHLMRFRAKHATEDERKSIELRAVLMTPYSKEDFDERTLAKRVFDALDINHDGHVVKNEFIEKFDLDSPACKVD